ncbi:ribonucleotide-diphosphate reductase subunit beta [Actinocorallia sp. B10E7]|uniref:ribonucleotide-diphosphate reductase subunit beta n=1 Tax=Actinocorallia sp. B10E7 TaxID=3153558 RepID=UPI00325CF66D
MTVEQMEAEEEKVISPADLFRKWEQQQWRLSDLRPADDRADWQAMGGYGRGELETMISGFVFGEAAVSATLSPLADAAPSLDAQQYLCTQIADEARHTRFFADYLSQVRGGEESREEVIAEAWSGSADAVSSIFDEGLRLRTGRLREAPDDRRAWYTAVTFYHLMAEGVLAMSVLGSMLSMVRQLRGRLAVLDTGLRNVIRDESRHMAFGMYAAREGVNTGHRQAVLQAILDAVPQVVPALVAPERRLPGTSLPPMRAVIAAQHERRYAGARRTLLRRMELIGLAEATEEAGWLWDRARKEAFSTYESLHGAPHPVDDAAS